MTSISQITSGKIREFCLEIAVATLFSMLRIYSIQGCIAIKAHANAVKNLLPYNLFSISKILSMIEEAAGTKMYESKKQSALRTMEKKESKLSEFEKVISSFCLNSLFHFICDLFAFCSLH